MQWGVVCRYGGLCPKCTFLGLLRETPATLAMPEAIKGCKEFEKNYTYCGSVDRIMANSTAEALQSYLDPEYWGDCALGSKPISRFPVFSTELYRSYRASRRVLQEYLNREPELVPTAMYEAGEILV